MGTTAQGTWWSPGQDQFTASSLWFFDPVGEAIPAGYRRDYQPTGPITPLQKNFPFVYTKSGNTITLKTGISNSRQTVQILRYDRANDVLWINWDGNRQMWVGCRSGRMPAVALAACR